VSLTQQPQSQTFTAADLRDCAGRETRVLRLRYQRWITRRKPRREAVRELAMMDAIVELLAEMAERERMG
jgi:hypothetical protein